MSKEQVMDYVMNSPANTNPNVLSGMLDSIAQSGGTSLVTNKYEIGEVTMQTAGQSAALNLSQPIALSKIRALWVATTRAGVVGGLVNYGGNLSADQVYQITFHFVRAIDGSSTSITFNPVVYITMEE